MMKYKSNNQIHSKERKQVSINIDSFPGGPFLYHWLLKMHTTELVQWKPVHITRFKIKMYPGGYSVTCSGPRPQEVETSLGCMRLWPEVTAQRDPSCLPVLVSLLLNLSIVPHTGVLTEDSNIRLSFGLMFRKPLISFAKTIPNEYISSAFYRSLNYRVFSYYLCYVSL